MKLKKVTSLLMFVLAFMGLSINLKAQTKTIRLTVKEEKGDCVGVAPQKCLLIKTNNGKNWENFYDSITNFNYQEGYRYVVDVIRTKRENIPADASAYSYKLKKIISKTKYENLTKTKSFANKQWEYVMKNKWKLIQINGKEQTFPNVGIEFEKTKVSGKSACNYFNGTYKINGNKISFGPMMVTAMACLDENINQVESAYFTALNTKKLTYDVADQTLNIYDGNKLVLIFAKTIKTK